MLIGVMIQEDKNASTRFQQDSAICLITQAKGTEWRKQSWLFASISAVTLYRNLGRLDDADAENTIVGELPGTPGIPNHRLVKPDHSRSGSVPEKAVYLSQIKKFVVKALAEKTKQIQFFEAVWNG